MQHDVSFSTETFWFHVFFAVDRMVYFYMFYKAWKSMYLIKNLLLNVSD